jgi:hypothetical protein
MPPNAENGNARSRGRIQNETLLDSDTQAATVQLPYAKCSTATLARYLSNAAQGSAIQHAIQEELRARFEQAINRIEKFLASSSSEIERRRT